MDIETDAATNAAGESAPAVSPSQVTESAPVANGPGAAAKPDDGFTRRIDELTGKWRSTERDRDHWREMALRNQRQQEPARKPQEQDTKVKTLSDFEYDESKYQSYLFEETEKRAVAAAEKRLKEQDEQASRQKVQAKFKQRIDEFSKTNPDFHEKVFHHANPVSEAMREFFEDSEEGPAVALYLASNQTIAQEIARMPARYADRELVRIEAKLIADRAAAAKTVSTAPPPPPTLDGADPKVEKAPKDMSDNEFAKWRKKHIAARR